MWLRLILGVSVAYAAFSRQIQQPFPFAASGTSESSASNRGEFSFKEGPDVFSPKDLVTLPRPGNGVANSAGDLVLVPVVTHSVEDRKNHKSIFVVPIESQVSPLEIPLAKGGDVFWLDPRTVALAVGDSGNKTSNLYAINIDFKPQGGFQIGTLNTSGPPILIGIFPTESATNFQYREGHDYLVFSDYVYADGDLLTVKEQDENWENRGNSALVYDATYERHWDRWSTPKSSSLFSVRLTVDSQSVWHLGSEYYNLLNGTGHSCPVEPFGGVDDFDVTRHHVVYTTLDPTLPKAWHTKQDIYYVDISGKGKPKPLTSGQQGATHSPVFNNKGNKVAWLELDKDGYESDRQKIVIYDLDVDVRYTLTQKWDRSPSRLAFSADDGFIYFTAGDHARTKIFVLPIPPTPVKSTTHPDLDPIYQAPVPLTHAGSASGIQIIPNDRLIFSLSSLTSPIDVYVLRGLRSLQNEILHSDFTPYFNGKAHKITDFTEAHLKNKNLSEGEKFWFKGAEDHDVHGWVLKPRGWGTSQKKWPIVLLIHGGPQDAWGDQWSNRWNPNVFAQQGYFTVAINPTGSATFGQAFIDAITEDWGGRPFVDLQAGWKAILNAYPEIDSERAVAAGASWGGYAINWIQGHPEYGFGFKALVCHDGVFDANYNSFSTDELFFFNHDFGGRPWDPKTKNLTDKFSPSNFVQKWSTPQLLIHGSKDYRLPETESIGAFHALLQKGIPSRLVIFPNENHWVNDPGNSLKWHYEVFRWFDEFAGEGGPRQIRLSGDLDW